jgi:predicted acetyltransferase
MSQTARITLRPPNDDKEIRALSAVLFQSFAGFGRPPETTDRWLEQLGPDNLRVVVKRRDVVGGLGILHFRHWLGGNAIPTAGITCVGVSPLARGGGVGAEMMRQLMRDFHEAGIPLSTLYPSTWGLYRKAGYEPAGQRMMLEIELSRIGLRDRALPIRPMTEADHPAVFQLHREFGRANQGVADRSALLWQRIFREIDDRVYAYVVESPDGARIDGYVVYTQKFMAGDPYELPIRDLAYANHAAARRLLTLLADHNLLAGKATLERANNDPLLAMMATENLKARHNHFWMLRVVDAGKALGQRGYCAVITAELHIELCDDLIESNNARYVLTIEDGKGAIRKGGRGRIKIDIRGLAPLMTSHLSAEQLQAAGLLDGPPGDLAGLSAAFAGPAPWMNDRF